MQLKSKNYEFHKICLENMGLTRGLSELVLHYMSNE